MNSPTAPTTFPCPSCQERIDGPRETCPACGITLTGPVAARLWQVDQQLAVLRDERRDLLTRLRAGSAVPGYHGYPRYPAPAQPHPEPVRHGPTGQQITLGLGALMLLSSSSLFMVVAWFLLPLVGKAVILAAMTAAAVGASRLAVRRDLPAAAETAAAIAVGLTVVGADAAHARGLAGLDGVPDATYWTVALLVCGGLFALFDRVEGGVRTSAPASAAAFALAPGGLLVALDVTGLRLQVGAGAAAAVLALAALVTLRHARRGSVRVAAGVLGAGALAGSGAFAGEGLWLAYDSGQHPGVRLAAAGLLVVAAALTRWTPGARFAPAAVATTLGLVAPAAVLEATYPVDAAIAGILAAASVVGLLGWRAAPRVDGWVASATACVVWLQVVVLAVVASDTDLSALPWWAPVAAAGGLLVTSAAGLGLLRSVPWVWAVQASAAVTTWAALRAAPALPAYVVLLVLMAAEIAVAVAALRGSRPLAWLLSTGAGIRAHAEGLAAGAAGAAFLGAVSLTRPAADASGTSEATLTAIACYAAAVVLSAYAGQRGRLALGYLASLLASCGTWLLLAHGDVSLVEAYTLPPALLLALVGAATWARSRGEGRTSPSLLTMGPALAVALAPSTVVGVTDGDTTRLVLVVAAAVACVVGGLALRVKAPVLAGGTSLVVIALTQGGPYLADVPGWVTIGAAGAVLLAVGVSWEQAVVAGRRSATWFSSLG